MALPAARPRGAALSLLLLAAGAAAAHGQTPAPGAPAEIPARFDEHRIYVRPVLESGDTIEFFTDTGGGEMMLYPDAVQRFRLKPDTAWKEGRAIVTAAFPAFRAGAGIPAGAGAEPGRLLVFPRNPTISGSEQGFLGQGWFAGGVWTFDYPARKLLLRAAGDVPQTDAAHRVPLFFKKDSAGGRANHFPRVRVQVAGDSLDLLFDTGASTVVSEAALGQLGGGARRGTSFIAESVFNRWRQRNPGWRVIDGAEQTTGQAMIEVPRLSVAGHEVGPVWFTVRADRNFSQFMSPLMDRPVVGALGGSALQYFRVTVDYPNGVAIFEKP